VNRDHPIALFRAHAGARFRGDTAEAERLAASLDSGGRAQHLRFQLSLFAKVFLDEYGDRPDPGDLAELTKRLHDKHFRADSNFNALMAEAAVRAVCGEPTLFAEIPRAELPGYMWAVMNELVGPDGTEENLAERFDAAEKLSLDLLTGAYECTAPARIGHRSQRRRPDETCRAAPQAHDRAHHRRGRDRREAARPFHGLRPCQGHGVPPRGDRRLPRMPVRLRRRARRGTDRLRRARRVHGRDAPVLPRR
jgi:hypothetical protein